MAETKIEKLDDSAIESLLASLDGWKLVEGKIAKSYSFGSYEAGLVFATSVGYVANRMDHHPDILIGYQKVEISVNTHDVGGISKLDFHLATRIDEL